MIGNNDELLRETRRLIAKSVEMAETALAPFLELHLRDGARKNLAVHDLLVCLLHYCGRNRMDFVVELEFAQEVHLLDLHILARTEKLVARKGGSAAEGG
mgnify:CR=1 FL=1